MQCRLSVQMLNICTVIFHCIQRGIQKISSNKTKVTNIPFYFLLQHQFLEFFIKAEFNYTNFWSTYRLLFVGFDVVIFLCHSHTPELNPSTVPINYTDYRWSQMQDFSAFWSQFDSYAMSFYWHPQILFDNKLKWFTHSCAHTYIRTIWLPEYLNIHMYVFIYTCMYFIVKIKLHCRRATLFYWYSMFSLRCCPVLYSFN